MPIVWYLSSTQFSGKTIVSGVLLNKKPLIFSPGASPLKNALMIMGSYFNAAWSNKNIIVQLEHKRFSNLTDDHGGFSVSFDFRSNDEVVIFREDRDEALRILKTIETGVLIGN